jgi:hypothetical protein
MWFLARTLGAALRTRERFRGHAGPHRERAQREPIGRRRDGPMILPLPVGA